LRVRQLELLLPHYWCFYRRFNGYRILEWAKYNNEIAKTNILVNGITSLGSDLDNVRAMALADYYGQDFNEILNTAKANVKKFGISYRSIR
jgi:hypothetical protein